MAYSATSFQLTHLLQRAYRRLKVAKTSIATGGSTTTIVDTKLLDYLAESNEDDILNGGSVIVVRDAGGSGAAPEGVFERITDYDDSGTVTFAAVSAAIAAGDTYMYITRDFPIYDMLEVVNDSLVFLGKIPRVDTSLTTANNQTEYTLPVGLKGGKIIRVEVQGTTTDANDNQYTQVVNWRIVDSDPGSSATLVIPQLQSGYTLRLTYYGYHPRINSYDDYISEYIHPELAVSSVVAHALEWYNSQRSGADDYWKQREDRAWNQLDIAKSTYPIRLPVKQIQGFVHTAGSAIADFPELSYS